MIQVVTALRSAGCVFAEDEARLLVTEAQSPSQLAAMVERRVNGLPLEHLLGWAEFCGHRVAVDPGVFVPRRRSESIVGEIARLRPRSGPVVVDLCCGSGAIGLAVALQLGRVALHAVDVDPAAVACARRNLDAIGGRVYQGDLFEPLPAALQGRVDLLIANAPYVPTGEIALLPPEARLHEARVALDGGPDGLDILRRVVAGAPGWLGPGGSLLVEASACQAPALLDVVARVGLRPRLANGGACSATVVIATTPG